MQKQDDVLMPFDAEAVDYVNRIKDGEILTCEVKRPRNPLYHNRAFACLHEMHDMIETELSFEHFRRFLIIKAGYFTTIGKVSINGDTQVAVEADSLSFESMSQDKFYQCFQDILQAFCNKFGKTLTLDQLENWARM